MLLHPRRARTSPRGTKTTGRTCCTRTGRIRREIPPPIGSIGSTRESGQLPGSELIPMVPNGSIVENRRVLLIENSQSDRLLLRSWLTTERIEVYDAVDIITGLAACARFQPNLILVQIHLHTWDGY